MEARELSPRNTVRIIEPHEYAGAIATISAVSELECVGCLLNIASSYGFLRVSALLEELQPIPLTPQFLESHGWVKQPRTLSTKKTCLGTWRSTKTDTTIKQYFLDRDNSIFVVIGPHLSVGNVKYIHQLQNILQHIGKTIQI